MAAVQVRTDQVVTIQATGGLHKALQLFGALLMIGGLVSCTATDGGALRGVGLFFVGGVTYLSARVSAWLRHG
jgi:hypothetical protein